MDTSPKPTLPVAPLALPSPAHVAPGPFVDFPGAARSHAKAARSFLADADEALQGIAESDEADFDRVDALMQAAQAHALTSLAFTQLLPPARRPRTRAPKSAVSAVSHA